MGDDEDQLDQLLQAVLSSPKYRYVFKDIIMNIGSRELQKRRSIKQAAKATKTKLHQIGGAYFLAKPDYFKWLNQLRKAKETGEPEEFKCACAEVMSYHQSTKERLPTIKKLYNKLFTLLPPVRSVIDLACGFHPLTIPWMPLEDNASYYAYDIYEDLMSFLGKFMVLTDVAGHAEAKDISQDPPKVRADMAFVLNAVAPLEQVEKGAGFRILKALHTDYIVVSFPVRSLGGKDKGMLHYYREAFDNVGKKQGWKIKLLQVENELVYLIKKTSII